MLGQLACGRLSARSAAVPRKSKRAAILAIAALDEEVNYLGGTFTLSAETVA